MPAYWEQQAPADTPRGGSESGFDGSNHWEPPGAGIAPQDPLANQGPLFQMTPSARFQLVDQMVIRQEQLSRNRLAIDSYWTWNKLGYGWQCRLFQLQDRSEYQFSWAPGLNKLETQDVPNKQWDLCNKATATLLVDLPKPRCTPLNTDETSENAAKLATEFLSQDGDEDGTNDPQLLAYYLDAAWTRASSFGHYWVDPTGGGYVPLQIEAHPQAQDPQNPMTGPDGMPTADPILRYVTTEGQFTNDPSQAAPQWVPKIRVDRGGREHIRCFPETADVNAASQIVWLYYCTLDEGKRRFPETVGKMAAGELNELCSWTPQRYLPLLPYFLRSRWKLTNGLDNQKAGSSDQRIFFWYGFWTRESAEHPRGAEFYLTGARGGIDLKQGTLAFNAPVPATDGTGQKTEIRCMEYPIVQCTPVSDPDGFDPMGRAYLSMFGGGAAFRNQLASDYLEALDIILHTEKYSPVTSPVTEDDIAESRATGKSIEVLSIADAPTYGQVKPMPNNVLDALNWADTQTDSMASLNKPVTGASDQQEVSGKARQIAVQQARISLGPMQEAVKATYKRHLRVKAQLAQRDFDAPYLLRFAGEDGSYQVASFKAQDFALVGDVGILDGTGTMMAPEAKVNYLAQLQTTGFIGAEEAKEAARSSFASSIGAPENPHTARIERGVNLWLDGPPPQWIEQRQAQMAEYQMQVQQAQAVYQPQAIAAQQQGLAIAPFAPPPVPLPAWTPFPPCFNDTELEVAQLWRRRLSKLGSSARYMSQPPEWRQVVEMKYQEARQVESQFAQAAAPQSQSAPSQPAKPQTSQPSGVAA